MYRLLNVCRRIYLSDCSMYSYYEQGMYNMYYMCCWNKEKCYMYDNHKYRMYSLCSWIHLQHYDQCGVLYHLFSCLCRRNHLSVLIMYCDKEQGLFGMYCLCRWNKEICDVYCVSKHWLYSLCSWIHL